MGGGPRGRPLVTWRGDGDTASPSEPAPSAPRAQKAWQPPTRARQGPGCHAVPPVRAVRSQVGHLETARNQPTSWDICPRFPNRDAKAFSSQRKERLLKVTANQPKNEHCRNVIGNNNGSCWPALWPNPVLSEGFILMTHPHPNGPSGQGGSIFPFHR